MDINVLSYGHFSYFPYLKKEQDHFVGKTVEERKSVIRTSDAADPFYGCFPVLRKKIKKIGLPEKAAKSLHRKDCRGTDIRHPNIGWLIRN